MSEYKEQHFAEYHEVPQEKVEKILPILEHRDAIVEQIKNNPSSIIVGETGSGKTTEIPKFLMEEFPDKNIVVTEPRKIAARSISEYVARQKGIKLGKEIGYKVRFEDVSGEGTRLNFVTDGLLLQECKSDPLLLKYDIVMVDEAHERSLNIDFTLGLLKNAQKQRRERGEKELKIVVTSATLEKEKFARYFDEAPVMEVPGRLYPVEVEYTQESEFEFDRNHKVIMSATAAETAKKIIETEGEGDILIFMPTEKEIVATIDELKSRDIELDAEILPLFGRLAPEEQQKVFQKFDKRKIIVATNIAETSITIDGVKFVIDSGAINEKDFDPKTGIESQVMRNHAKSGCDQRKGRAGRTAPGKCFRLYDKILYEYGQEFQKPEIARSNLDHVVLMMKKMGIDDVASFDFIDPPEKASFKHAIETLKILGALDENEKLTLRGDKMSEFPLSPEKARMIIEAEKYGCVESVFTIAAMMGSKSVFNRPQEYTNEADLAHAQFKDNNSDFITLLNVWRKWEESGHDTRWARNNFLNSRQLFEAGEVRFQLMEKLKRLNIIATNTNNDEELVKKSIASGLVQNFMTGGFMGEYSKITDIAELFPATRSEKYFIHPSSVLFGYSSPEFIIASNIVKTKKTYARLCQEVKPEWLVEFLPHYFIKNTEEQMQRVDYDKQEVIKIHRYTFKTNRYKSFLVEERIPISQYSEAKAKEDKQRQERYSFDRNPLRDEERGAQSLTSIIERIKKEKAESGIFTEDRFNPKNTYSEITNGSLEDEENDDHTISQEEFLERLRKNRELQIENARIAKEEKKHRPVATEEKQEKIPEKEVLMTEELRKEFDTQLVDSELYLDILKDILLNIKPKKEDQEKARENLKNNLKEFRKKFNEYKKEISEIDSVSRIKGLLATILGETKRIIKGLEKNNFLPLGWLDLYQETLKKAYEKAKEIDVEIDQNKEKILKEKIVELTIKRIEITEEMIGNIVVELI